MSKEYKCPKCDGEVFEVTAHVTQDWQINSAGTFIKSIDNCVEVTHYPNDDDLWDCFKCGFSATGIIFRIMGD